MRIHDEVVYLTDNGAAYCGEHLGASAKLTGRGLDGQAIDAVTPEYATEFKAIAGRVPECEHPTCGRKASLLIHAGV